MADALPEPPVVAMDLKSFCRALAAHALLMKFSFEMQSFMAPEVGEQVAEFIEAFARGEAVSRPPPPDADHL